MMRRAVLILRYELRRSAVVAVWAFVIGGTALVTLAAIRPDLSVDEATAIVGVPLAIAYVLFKVFAAWAESLPEPEKTDTSAQQQENELPRGLLAGIGSFLFCAVFFVGVSIALLISAPIYPLLEIDFAGPALRLAGYAVLGLAATIVLAFAYFFAFVAWVFRKKLVRLGGKAMKSSVLFEAQQVRRMHRAA